MCKTNWGDTRNCVFNQESKRSLGNLAKVTMQEKELDLGEKMLHFIKYCQMNMFPCLYIFYKSQKYLRNFCRKSANKFTHFLCKKIAHLLGLSTVLRLFHV